MHNVLLSMILWLGATLALAGEMRYIGGRASHPISFGLEIEFDLTSMQRSQELLTFYRVETFSGEVWQQLTPSSKRAAAMEALLTDKYFHRIDRDRSHMSEAEAWFYDHLPPILDNEANGNLEFCGSSFIFTTLAELKKFIAVFATHFGQGDVQGHIVFPDTPLPGAAGYMVYEHDRAMLRRFSAEYRQYQADARKTPAINIVARNLRLIDSEDLAKTLLAERWTNDPLFLATLKGSRQAKALGLLSPTLDRDFRIGRRAAPIFRKEGYPLGYSGFELRMEDNPSEATSAYRGSYGRLTAALDRASKVLAYHGSFGIFSRFQGIVLHNPDWWSCNQEAQKFLGRYLQGIKPTPLTPNHSERLASMQRKLAQGLDFSKEFECSVFNNALFPLRQWESHPLVEASDAYRHDELVNRIRSATFDYLETMVSAGFSDHNSPRPVEEMYTLLRVGVAEWASKVDLLPLFDAFEHQYIKPRGQKRTAH